MKKNRIARSLIEDLLIIFLLFFVSYYLEKIENIIYLNRIVVNNCVSNELIRNILYFSGSVYAIITLLTFRRIQNSIVKLAKYLVVLLNFCIIILYLIFVMRNSEGNAFMLYLVLAFIIIVFLAIKSLLLVMNNRVLLNSKGIEIKGDYGQIIQFGSINQITVKYSLPELSYRIRGVVFMNIKKGQFELSNGDKCFIYINLEKPLPILKIDRNDGLPIFLNCKTPQQTLTLYAKYRLMQTKEKLV